LLLEESVARGELRAPELVVAASMDGLVALKTSARTKGFSAMGANERTVILVGSLDMLLEMFLLHVRLVAAIHLAYERSFSGMGSLVGRQSRGSIKCLCTSRELAGVLFIVAL